MRRTRPGHNWPGLAAGGIHFRRGSERKGPHGHWCPWEKGAGSLRGQGVRGPGRGYHPVPVQRIINGEKIESAHAAVKQRGRIFCIGVVTGRLRRFCRACRAVSKFFLALFLTRKRANRGCRRGPGGEHPGSRRAPGSAGSPRGTCPCPQWSSSPWGHTLPPPG